MRQRRTSAGDAAGDGQVRMLQMAENFRMGVQNDLLTSQSESILPGEMLVMFTDGLSDLTDTAGIAWHRGVQRSDQGAVSNPPQGIGD
jgi:serine phosphatase RsbU (regulator of sigma subunit)